MLETFERFLENLPLEEYKEKYSQIKTVEQNLPRTLNPLRLLYKHYWKPNIKGDGQSRCPFPPFDEFFKKWWKENPKKLCEFIEKHFWGCSLNFVKLGLEARLYRTATSVWTQFHLAYLWKKASRLKIRASWELDAKEGIDAVIRVDGKLEVGLQVKKESHRTEAGRSDRFSQKKKSMPIVEVPYTLASVSELKDTARKARSKEEEYSLWIKVAEELRPLSNGFVVFKDSYVRKLEAFLLKEGRSLPELTSWREIAEKIL
ncbi:MAG: TaqI family restriction endonuclease [Candidatus Bipolaricaulaceae bacterium]